jgi:hypothetical protein
MSADMTQEVLKLAAEVRDRHWSDNLPLHATGCGQGPAAGGVVVLRGEMPRSSGRGGDVFLRDEDDCIALREVAPAQFIVTHRDAAGRIKAVVAAEVLRGDRGPEWPEEATTEVLRRLQQMDKSLS